MKSQRMQWIAVAALALSSFGPAWSAWDIEGLKPVTRGGEAMAPVMAPDGRRVAYLVGQRTESVGGAPGAPAGPSAPAQMRGRLWLLDHQAGEAALLGRFPVEAVEGERLVAFAPSGGAYAYVEGRRAEPTLWYVDEKGDRLRVGSGRAAAFGPKGDLLAYTVWDTGAPAAVELWLFEVERRESKRLARMVVAAPIELSMPAVAPRWMPDAERIMFDVHGDLYAYGRFTGRIEALTRSGDVRSADIAPNGAVWFFRDGRERDAAGIWNLRPDGKASMRAFRADELPPGITSLSAGPDAGTVLFLAETAAGRGLVAADAKDGRWRFVAAADAFSPRPRSPDVALEAPAAEGRRNIYVGRLVPESSRAGR